MNRRSWLRAAGLVALVCALAQADAFAVAADRYGSNSRIVFREDAAPGLAAGETVVGLDHFSVGDGGNVLIVGAVGPGAEVARAVWYGPPDAIELIYRDDLPVPGSESRGDVGSLLMGRMSGNGDRVAFLTDAADSARIWIHAAGVTQMVRAREDHFYRHVSIANNGVLVAGVARNYYDLFTLYSVHRGYPEILYGIVDEMGMIPGFGVEVGLSLENAISCDGPATYRATDTNGHYLALVGLVDKGYKTTAWEDCSALYFNGGSAGSGFVLYAGQEAPGAPAGHRFVDYGFDEAARLDRASVSEDERVVFQWETALDGADWSGLWSYSDRAVTLVVGEGDPIANRPGLTVRPNTTRTIVPGGSGETRLWNLPQSDRSGDIVFPGEILETGNPAIFRYADGQVEVLAEAGHPFEDGSDYSWASVAPSPAVDSPFMTPYVNAPGQVLLWAAASDELGATIELSPWVIDRSGIAVAVALPGDAFEFAAGDERFVTPQGLHDGAAARWTGGSVLSDAGHVLTRVASGAGWGILYTEAPDAVSAAPGIVVAGERFGVRLLPQPFPGQGVIELRTASREPVRITIYDAAGRLVRRLDPRAGEQELTIVRWDGRNGGGSHMASGVYFVQAEQGRDTVLRKLVLVR